MASIMLSFIQSTVVGMDPVVKQPRERVAREMVMFMTEAATVCVWGVWGGERRGMRG